MLADSGDSLGGEPHCSLFECLKRVKGMKI
jgi:hypothetical protein